jgi:hypothetical protein
VTCGKNRRILAALKGQDFIDIIVTQKVLPPIGAELSVFS